jgi:hypothetical protein
MVFRNLRVRLEKLGCRVVEKDLEGWDGSGARFADSNSTIVVHNEGDWDQLPFRGFRCVHYLLYFRHTLPADWVVATFGWDVIDGVNGPPFAKKLPSQLAVNLWVADYNVDLVVANPPPGRVGSFYVLHKASVYWNNDQLHQAIAQIDAGQIEEIHHIPSVEVKSPDPEMLCLLCRTKRIFYSFDLHTFRSVLAAACGCVSVVLVPPGHTVPSPWPGVYGVTAGIALGKHNIETAVCDRSKLIQQLHCMDLYADLSVKHFAFKTQNWDTSFGEARCH